MIDPRIEYAPFAHDTFRGWLPNRQIDLINRLLAHIQLEDQRTFTIYVPTAMPRNRLDDILRHYHQPANVSTAHHAFLHAHPAPPITVASLQPMQFDTGMKMQPKLRQDLSFDMEIYIRPGGTHHPTQPDPQRAARYWLAIQCELEYWAILRDARTRTHITEAELQTSFLGRHTRLLRMFEEVVELTNLVVPVRFQQEIGEVIDPARQVRNIKEGVTPDYRALADYMRGHLLPQCAPERDPWVESVRDGIAALTVDGSHRAIAAALRGLFGLLFTLTLVCQAGMLSVLIV